MFLVRAKNADLHVMGFIKKLDISYLEPDGEGPPQGPPKRITLRNVFVIDGLPVPVHVSFGMGGYTGGWNARTPPRFLPEAFPEGYRSHKYWVGEDGPFMPYLKTSLANHSNIISVAQMEFGDGGAKTLIVDD
ncbi:hypothetical protein HDU76_003820 [Blyttiomyces sp. JEL0837]|nr:hypothetical protein HDU76_003820 [Blyttiomyces sp. JEL0837]